MPDFPANPSSGEIFEVASGVYRWDGTKWTLLEQPEEIGVPWLVANPVGSNGVKAIPPMFDANAYLSPPLMMEQIWNEINAGGGGGGVSSFNTRTGAVTLTTADVTAVGGALLDSPALTGTPTAPTPSTADNSTSIATTAFVKAQNYPSDAPSDNTWYGRTNATWSNVVPMIALNQSPTIGQGAGNLGTATGLNNVSIGFQASSSVTTGASNIAIGNQALKNNVAGNSNVAIGNAALTNATGGFNIGIGGGNAITTGTNNIAIAGLTSGAGVTGAYNISIGYTSLSSATTAAQNIALGLQSMQNLTTGGSNIAIGASALRASVSDSNNIAIGAAAGTAINGGNYDVIVGNNSGSAITTGIRNTIIGGSAGAGIVTGGTNILIGYGANVPTGDPSGHVNIGGKLQYDQYNNILLGANQPTATVTGTFNVNAGFSAGAALTTGGSNVNIGLNAGTSLTTISNAVNIGTQAGRYSTGANNVIVGNSAGQGVSGSTTGIQNTFIGVNAGLVFTTAASNVSIGFGTGAHLTTGSNCTFVGNSAGASATANNYNTCVGNLAGVNITTGANNTILGARSATDAIVTGNGNILVGYNANAPSDTTNYINIGGLITGQMDTGPIAISKAVNFTGSIGVNGTAAPAKPTVSGAKGSNAALASLIAALVSYGLIIDTTTA